MLLGWFHLNTAGGTIKGAVGGSSGSFESLLLNLSDVFCPLKAELATPTQFKGRLNELLSQVRLQSQTAVLSGGAFYTFYIMI